MLFDINNTADSSVLRVLHVDDDTMILETVARFLEHEADSVDIVTETDPTAVPTRIDEERIHCVVSDYQMPELDGLELCQMVRERRPELPFVLYTGKGSEDIAARAIDAGVNSYLQKGGVEQIRRLMNRVERAVEECRAKGRSRRYARVLRALGYPMYVVDDEPRFRYVNEAFAELTGYDREEIIGSRPALVKTEAGVERSTEALRTVLSTAGPDTEQFDIQIRTKAGEEIACRDHLAADIQNGELRASVGILQRQREDVDQSRELRD